MNTGYLLRKKGESYDSIVRRFWLANRGVLKVTKSREIDLVADLSDRGCLMAQRALESGANSDQMVLNLINAFEAETEAEISLPVGELYARNPFSNCHYCSKIGYHSNFFNAVWMKTCPIHNVELNSFCKTCNQVYPNRFKVRRRSCKDCGSKIRFRELVKRNAFKRRNYTEKFRLLVDLFESPPKGCVDRFNYVSLINDFQMTFATKITESFAFPSFVAAESSAARNEIKSLFCECGITLYPLFKIEFEIESVSGNIYPWDIKYRYRCGADNVRFTIFTRTVKELLSIEDINHEYGTNCPKTLNNIKPCPICSILRRIKRAPVNVDSIINNDLFRYKVYDHFVHEITEPDVITAVETSGHLVQIPTDISMLLYEVELWTQIRLMYFRLNMACQTKIPPRTTYYNLSTLQPEISGTTGSYSFPYFIVKNGNQGKIYIPETFREKNLHVDDDFLALIFPNAT